MILPEGQGNPDSFKLKVNLKDDEGTILPDVEIKLLNNSKNILETQLTNNNGIVTFNNLEANGYFVRINKQSGYKIFEDAPVSVTNNTEISLVLEIEN